MRRDVRRLRSHRAARTRDHFRYGVFALSNPDEKYVDFKVRPELIRVSLPDFRAWDHYPAVQAFYALFGVAERTRLGFRVERLWVTSPAAGQRSAPNDSRCFQSRPHRHSCSTDNHLSRSCLEYGRADSRWLEAIYSRLSPRQYSAYRCRREDRHLGPLLYGDRQGGASSYIYLLGLGQ